MQIPSNDHPDQPSASAIFRQGISNVTCYQVHTRRFGHDFRMKYRATQGFSELWQQRTGHERATPGAVDVTTARARTTLTSGITVSGTPMEALLRWRRCQHHRLRRPGPVESGVTAEIGGLAAEARPGLAQAALALARIMDNPKAVNQQPAAAKVLAASRMRANANAGCAKPGRWPCRVWCRVRIAELAQTEEPTGAARPRQTNQTSRSGRGPTRGRAGQS